LKTKLFYLIAFSFLLISTGTFAQLELKPAAGVNITDFSKDPSTGKTSARVGWQFGGTISFGDRFYGEGGLFYLSKSNEFTEDATNNKFDTELTGIRFPVMVGYHLLGKETGLAGLRAFGGASVFILTDQKNPLDLTKDDFTTATYGVFLGAGVDIAFVFVDFKYEWSLSDVSSVTKFDVGKSRSIFINGGVRISL